MGANSPDRDACRKLVATICPICDDIHVYIYAARTTESQPFDAVGVVTRDHDGLDSMGATLSILSIHTSLRADREIRRSRSSMRLR